MTVSLGFAMAGADQPVSYDQLRETAATAMKQAKDEGRNRSIMKAAD
jgi:GGDEF domain-containing protein